MQSTFLVEHKSWILECVFCFPSSLATNLATNLAIKNIRVGDFNELSCRFPSEQQESLSAFAIGTSEAGGLCLSSVAPPPPTLPPHHALQATSPTPPPLGGRRRQTEAPCFRLAISDATNSLVAHLKVCKKL